MSSLEKQIIKLIKLYIKEDLAQIYYSDNHFHIDTYVDTTFPDNIDQTTQLDHLTTFQFNCTCDNPHYFFFILPLKEAVKFTISQIKNCLNPFSKLHDRISYLKWTVEDREFLKRLILQYGYGRWNKINDQSLQSNGKLHLRGKGELRSFSNAFVRSVAELIQHQNAELKNQLLDLIEELAEDPYIETNQKDWDLQNLKLRLSPVGKRIVMLQKIRRFIKCFKEEQYSKMETKDKKQINWDQMLGFVPSTLFYSQRPSIWWTRKHDSDLIRGVYKYGYTNHTYIKQAQDLCFRDLEKSNTYHEFPQPETLNRRVKKLVQIIDRYEQENNQFDFNNIAQSDEDEKNWTNQEKQTLFELLCDYGVPIGQDGRQNWQVLKEKLNEKTKWDKNVSQLEKMVQTIRTKCEQIMMKAKIYENESSESSSEIEEQQQEEQFEIKKEQLTESNLPQDEYSIEEAQKFSKNTNMLHFIRKNIIPQITQLFSQHKAEIQKEQYSEQDDILLLQTLANQGFSAISSQQERVEFLCQFFKRAREQQALKRKTEYILRDDVQKKVKVVEKDINGELVLPMQVNASLKLLNLGRIIPSPFYHSEHNLFPVGYKSIRTYASMFQKGVKCQYTCEILEGQDGRPLFKVISEEDPENPIVRTSCTGCWVYICQKVNDLQEHKKQKVTISGTDRFGLLEPNVQRYLEELQYAEKCTKYKFKYRMIL